jgi:hypothetical protein
LYAPKLQAPCLSPNILYEQTMPVCLHGEDVDKYTSLDNGVCFMMRGKQASCIYLIIIMPPNFTQQKVDVYPGADSLSLKHQAKMCYDQVSDHGRRQGGLGGL